MQTLPLLPSLFHQHTLLPLNARLPLGFGQHCINPRDNGAALRGGPTSHLSLGMWGSLCGHTAEMPQAQLELAPRGGGEAAQGPGRGQLVPDLFKGQRFSTLLMGGGGCRVGPLLLNTPPGGGWWGSEIWRPRPCAQHAGQGRHRRGLCFPGKRGPPPFSRQPSWVTLLAAAPAPSWVSCPFCQHSVNTQYCIKAINRHLKESRDSI